MQAATVNRFTVAPRSIGMRGIDLCIATLADIPAACIRRSAQRGTIRCLALCERSSNTPNQCDNSSMSHRLTGLGDVSKYPPANPGALELWPLKAAGGDADAAPEIVSRLKRRLGALAHADIFS
jgi:hypothetical protein